MPDQSWRPIAFLATLLVGVLLLQPARAQTACPDILLGDSLAVGMAPHARALGFQVIAQQGAGIGWLRQQEPRCARRLILVFGTNDLRGMSRADAEAYPLRIAAIMERWDVEQMIWATPGCFQDEQLERGSLALDAALSGHLRRASDRLRDLPAIHSGRMTRCTYPSHDGVHPTGVGYQAWWAGISQWLERGRVTGL